MFQVCHLGVCVREDVYRGRYLAELKTVTKVVVVPELLSAQPVGLELKRGVFGGEKGVGE
jgi:hypothetical protein